MHSRVLLAFSVLFISASSAAQPDSTVSSPHYFLSVHAGGLFGKKGNGSSLTTAVVQGVRYQRFALGAGIGYDAYQDWQTLPMFGSLSYDILKKRKNIFFLQLHAGYSKAWNPFTNEQQISSGLEAGRLFHPQIGYRLTSGKLNVSLSVGYKFQRLKYESTPMWWGWGTKTTVKRDIERLSFQLGIGFR